MEGDRGREPGTIRAGDGREAGGDKAGCGSHARAGGGRRMRDIKIFKYFLVPFISELSKSEPKNINYSLFYYSLFYSLFTIFICQSVRVIGGILIIPF